MEAKFITVEGQDGAGKSTNLQVIAKFLQNQDIPFVQTREPGGTRFGEQVRKLLLDSDDDDFGEMAELLLVFAARAQHLEEVIEPALNAGSWVLCDRFTDATFAYQGGGRGMSTTVIGQLQTIVQRGRQPDLTLLLDLPVDVGEQRAGQRSAADRFEVQELAFKQRVRDAYLAMAAATPERFRVIDASLDIESVATSIQNELRKFLT